MFKELNVLEPFFEKPTKEFSVRELAKVVKISPATASSKLRFLEKRGLVSYRKEHNLDLYKADLTSYAFRDIKVYYNIRKIRESGIIEELNNFYLKPTIVLFGSMSFGLDTETSDIDLLILTANKEPFPKKEVFEEKLRREIQIFAVKDMKELRNEHLISNILNGITLQGELNWSKVIGNKE